VWDIKNGELESVRKEIENKGIDVNQEVDGRPLILYAADYGQVNIINYLLSKGANPNAKDKHGISTLLAAIWEGHTDCVKLLLSKVCALYMLHILMLSNSYFLLFIILLFSGCNQRWFCSRWKNVS